MKNRGKSAATETTYVENNKFSNFNYSISSDTPCIKHPNSSPIGICSFCLKDKLLNLICSNDTNGNSSSSVEVVNVGKIEKQKKREQVILMRSSSNRVEIKKNRNGFWKIKRLFKKNRENGDEKIDGVSRSRSLCSFRGGGGDDDGSSEYRFSSAKISDVTGGLLFDYVDHVVEPRKSDHGGDFKNLRKKFASSESVCCSKSPKMLSVVQKRSAFRGSDMHVSTFLKSPSNVNLDGRKFCHVKESDFGNTMVDDGDFKNLRKKFPNSESVYCLDSPNMLPILQKGKDHTTFFKSPNKVNLDGGNFFPVKESDFGDTMDDHNDIKNMRKKFPDSESLCCSGSPNMLSILQKHTMHSATFLKSPNKVNSDGGIYFPVKGSDIGNTMDNDNDFKNMRKQFPNSDSLCYSDFSNMLSHSRQILQKRNTSHSTSSFLKSSSNTMDYDDDSAFIDLKLDLLSSSSTTSLSEPKLELFSESANSMGNLRGGSCRMNEYDKRMKEGNSGKGNKVWKWISWKKTTTSKRDEINSNLIIKY